MKKRIKIPTEEFCERKDKLLASMKEENLDLLFVYGDEYRKENLRYVSNFWPLFERGAALFSNVADPVVLCAPEGGKVCEEMSIWEDIRIVPDFLCVTVPDDIEYPFADFTDFRSIAVSLNKKGCKLNRIGVAGLDAMSGELAKNIQNAFEGEIVDANNILSTIRKKKSAYEIQCLKEAARIADTAFKTFIESNLIGLSEIEAAAIIENAARKEGAEQIIFNVLGTGNRTETIIGRPSYKIIKDGDMIMCALAVQYEGYVATCEVPFAVGAYSSDTKHVIDVLIRASAAGIPELKAGNPMKNFVNAVKSVFHDNNLSEYDVYPPLHGIGCAEAESPYPNSHTDEVFEVGMTCNTDISLFGLKGGSNRIEEGFVITEDGAETLSPFCRQYCENWLKNIK